MIILSVFSNLQSFSLKRGPILPSFNDILQVVDKSSERSHQSEALARIDPAYLLTHARGKTVLRVVE